MLFPTFTFILFFLPLNFNAPYRAENIADFWRKWHITLGRFLMQALYIPLGGNRCSKLRICLNLWIVFLVSGIWHGAGWMFILWGIMHGTALCIHRIWSKYAKLKMPRLLAQILTFLFVALAWVPFRATSGKITGQIYKAVFMPESFKFAMPSLFEISLFMIGFIIICFMPTSAELGKKFRPTWYNAVLTIVLTVVSMFLFVKVSPFIYFNF